jgi:hypothetical protein
VKQQRAPHPAEGMLQDFVYELHDLLDELDRDGSVEKRLGAFQVAAMLESGLRAFQIDQSGWHRKMPNMDEWLMKDLP